ncbi:Cof-type HAD-IIB family hydrolase [Mycoplasma anatis]|uniref:Cof-type HAD-IIB family hydrolase n=1 Tax=Mycoplasmopsis anatis TaxID=171279 RepID=A0A9Q3L9F9_9BACT|nr:Cof-type HAD-IIB family hydrolase [Mycoplasmopsis anatis]MBW0596191.1 Cof-type HAD-IIB family hydrolase [Mycoplasmopsis anatis]MBW0596869.1 Cof-type HAD-IIB family hydrolase [Mycoplasmopsis anatis]MBW0597625.1 Cof-type HAD-IIB family hydrolase [Mycoplasmopsis anatis]MBW0599677.1 Cof-type HAD-IIB family hydrolase [Mycoplasmopsis anatis]MBW0600568.1 Cof-type HAD-IIB family hydrolase [Mycoplasmopsis anatis]
MIRKLFIQEKFLKKIREGKKTIEMRLNDPRRHNLKEGMVLKLENIDDNKDVQLIEITKINKYKNFDELYKCEDPILLGYDCAEEANPNDMLYFYSREKQDEWGVIAIHFNIVNFSFDLVDTFIFDMDGTSLNSKGIVSNENKEAFAKLKSLNKNIIVATGRPHYTAFDWIPHIGTDLPIITANGSMIYDHKNKKMLHFESIPKDEAKLIYRFLHELEYDFLVYTTVGILGNNANKTDFFVKSNYKTRIPEFYQEGYFIDQIDNYDVTKFLVITTSNSQRILNSVFDFMSECKGSYIVQSQWNMVDIQSKKASKGNGLKFLLKELNLDINRTISFGDADNDISNFDVTKFSVAMKEASSEVKSAAVLQTKSNDEPWINDFIEKYSK